MKFAITDLMGAVGTDLGRSRTVTLDQRQIDLFADVTGDGQWIHTDPVRAAAGPFGTTIVHGYFTLSLVPMFLTDLFEVDGVSSFINYGLDRVRFPSPVPVDSELTATGTIKQVANRGDDVRVDLRVVIEVADSDRPACIADVLVLLQPDR